MHDFKGKDILDGAQFTRQELEYVMDVAEDMRERLEENHPLDLMDGYVLGALFFEPSTRTRLSFETAMHRLGGSVMRHPKIGSAREAAAVATVPVINGGDGAGQHPTQALLDLFTIRSERGQVDSNTIALCGDLKYGRTVHAGVELYKHYDCKLIFVAPEPLQMPPDITAQLREHGVKVEETTDLEGAMGEADVLYMTRIQKERFEDPAEYQRLKGSYVLTREMVERINPGLTILHPLPRVDEIATGVDDLPGAAYFRQARNGVYVRMALIALVAGRI
jgi:aspartate carbamoyltransferase catalytic subunit